MYSNRVILAFIVEQRSTLGQLVDVSPVAMSPASSVSGLSTVADFPSPASDMHMLQNIQLPPMQQVQPAPFHQLAREFGVELHIVEALARRLSDIC